MLLLLGVTASAAVLTTSPATSAVVETTVPVTLTAVLTTAQPESGAAKRATMNANNAPRMGVCDNGAEGNASYKTKCDRGRLANRR